METECKESSIGHTWEIDYDQTLTWDDDLETILVKATCSNCNDNGILRFVEGTR